jgi:hypothetical protein
MSDRYVHTSPERMSVQDHDNLVALARHLILAAEEIEAAGGLVFGPVDMTVFRPLPTEVTKTMSLPPFAHGPLAGIRAEPGETWPAYLERGFGLVMGSPFMQWLQTDLWARTEPSAIGAGLRIAYVLDYGVPHDHVEIAMGQAHTDYDSSGFLWEKLRLSRSDVDPSLPPKKTWPRWIGAVEQTRRRAEVLYSAANLVPNLTENGIARPDEIEGCSAAEIALLEHGFGEMPQSYRDFLGLVGRRSGLLVDRRELWIHADQLDDVNRMARERIFEWPEPEDDPVPKDAVFIGARYGEHPWFVLGGNRADSPVFHFNSDTGKVSWVAVSVWGWVQALVMDMNQTIRLRPEERETIRKIAALQADMESGLGRAREQDAKRRHGAKVASWTLASGALALGVAGLLYLLLAG